MTTSANILTQPFPLTEELIREIKQIGTLQAASAPTSGILSPERMYFLSYDDEKHVCFPCSHSNGKVSKAGGMIGYHCRAIPRDQVELDMDPKRPIPCHTGDIHLPRTPIETDLTKILESAMAGRPVMLEREIGCNICLTVEATVSLWEMTKFTQGTWSIIDTDVDIQRLPACDIYRLRSGDLSTARDILAWNPRILDNEVLIVTFPRVHQYVACPTPEAVQVALEADHLNPQWYIGPRLHISQLGETSYAMSLGFDLDNLGNSDLIRNLLGKLADRFHI